MSARTRKLRLAAAVAIVGSVAAAEGPAHADWCNGRVTRIETPAATFYLDVRETADLISIPSPFLYMESNGVAGLQRGGTSVALVLRDACNSANPDLFIA